MVIVTARIFEDAVLQVERVVLSLGIHPNDCHVRVENGLIWTGAFETGELVGVVGVKRYNHGALITGWFVMPDFRGKGVGQALLDAAVRVARVYLGTDLLIMRTAAKMDGYRGWVGTGKYIKTYKVWEYRHQEGGV